LKLNWIFFKKENFSFYSTYKYKLLSERGNFSSKCANDYKNINYVLIRSKRNSENYLYFEHAEAQMLAYSLKGLIVLLLKNFETDVRASCFNLNSFSYKGIRINVSRKNFLIKILTHWQ